MNLPRPPFAVLFDLDGTLLDTAPDMVAALNQLRSEHEAGPVPYSTGRSQVSNGSAGLLQLGFPDADPVTRTALQQRFLDLYAARLAQDTALFPGMDAVLRELEQCSIRWGVVTNKPGWLTEPLLEALGLHGRSACIVSGDTLSERKPHPGPLLHALDQLRLATDRAVYVGDALRDIQAGRAAGMRTILARYGYLMPDQDAADWGADRIIDQPLDLLDALRSLQ